MNNFVKWYCTVASLVASIVYILAGADLIYYGELGAHGESPPFIFFAAGAFYILVGYLVRLDRRWLRITLMIINALIMLIFFQMWAGRPDILTSAAGLGTKIAQFLLETGIVFLVVKTNRHRSYA